MKYTKLVIERSRFNAGQYDINLANEAEREVATMQARIEKLEGGLLRIIGMCDGIEKHGLPAVVVCAKNTLKGGQ